MKIRLGTSGLTLAVLWGCVVVGLARPVEATLDYGSLGISGSLESQNLFRMRRPGKFNPIQQRNTLRLGVELGLVKSGKLPAELSHTQVQVPWIRRANLLLLYRGVYDSVYDWAPGGNLYDITGNPVGGLSDLSSETRKNLRFPDNDLREAYIDLDFRGIPLSLRLGKQQIVWGETDNFRLLDRVNSLDLTWHLQQEIEAQKGWERLRVPTWMIKWRLLLPDLGPISDTFLEGYWNPGDWRPAKRGFLPEFPWSIPFANPYEDIFPNGLANGTTIFRQGDYARNPAENSQVGVRLSGYTGGVDFTLAYMWQRWAGDDGSNAAVVSALRDPDEALAATTEGKLPAEFIAPRTHLIGFSASYPEERFTKAVLKSEMLYIIGVPFQDGDKPSPVLPSLLFGTTKRDMWQGMLGFDRPVWMRWLNPDSSWYLLGQFFWHYVVDNSHATGDQTGFVGNLSPSQPLEVRGTGEPCSDPRIQSCKAVNTINDFETVTTLTATTFYMNGKLTPQITYVVNPTNQWNMEVFWGVDYAVTPNFTANLAQRYFINTTSDTVYEPWGIGGFNRGRSETQIRFTLQF